MREIGSGQTADADDSQLVEDRYDVKLSEWRDRGLVWWANTDRATEEIPDNVFQIVVDLMENEMLATFGRENPSVQRRAIEEQLLAGLRRHLMRRPSGESTEVIMF